MVISCLCSVPFRMSWIVRVDQTYWQSASVTWWCLSTCPWHWDSTTPCTLSLWVQCENTTFIALIHPIQWTIANPVGADRPAKRQKKTSCVNTGWPVPVLCIRQVAHGIYFLSRQHDVIASFSFGACTVQTCFQQSPDILKKSVHYDGFYTLFASNLL